MDKLRFVLTHYDILLIRLNNDDIAFQCVTSLGYELTISIWNIIDITHHFNYLISAGN